MKNKIGKNPSLHFSACPICTSHLIEYLFVSNGYPVCQCSRCDFMFLNPQPSDQVLSEIYSKEYLLGGAVGDAGESTEKMKKATADLLVQSILKYTEGSKGRLLEVGCGSGGFLTVAKSYGFDVAGIDVSKHACAAANRVLKGNIAKCGTLENLHLPEKHFDVCVMSDVLEHARNPIDLLTRVNMLLKEDGVLLVNLPSLDSWSARVMRQNWVEFKAEHLTYFNSQTLQNALAKAGFCQVKITPTYKYLTPFYIYHHFKRFKIPLFSALVSFIYFFVPGPFKMRPFKIVASGISALSRPERVKARPKLSIIVPIYNEINTFTQVMEKLLSKKIAGATKEILIVESNSTDGTRKAVEQYSKKKNVKIIFEDHPYGKGHAVRSGIKAASGKIILIQDADLEYDIDDYEQLLAPILNYEKAFVLGSRHTGGWKIQKFTAQPLKAIVIHIGRLSFSVFLGLMYRIWIKDPFTMFKVFRRDCLDNLFFKTDEFDFDIELLVKLLRKGYRPIQMPVNYSGRSYAEGKKVSLLRHGFLALKALFEFRFKSLYK